MTLIKVSYIFTEQGEFLYDPVSHKIYSCAKPFKFIGYFDTKTQKIKNVCV
jgi:hypothetical protein